MISASFLGRLNPSRGTFISIRMSKVPLCMSHDCRPHDCRSHHFLRNRSQTLAPHIPSPQKSVMPPKNLEKILFFHIWKTEEFNPIS